MFVCMFAMRASVRVCAYSYPFSAPSVHPGWQQTLWVSQGFSKFCGLTLTENDELFALGQLQHGGCVLVKIHTNATNSLSVFATMPHSCRGDGLA